MYNQGLEWALHSQFGSVEPQPQLDNDHSLLPSHGNGGNDQVINVLCIHNSIPKGKEAKLAADCATPKWDSIQRYSACL